ncbi:membrane protein [Flavobacterium lutivivi]|nr:membrane protein [Flavobacterium lutivivi]
MIDKRLIFILLIISQFTFSQIKGIVKDSISGEPIPYVNIWVENENIGTTSEEDGTFTINANEEKKLVFSALGYEEKEIISKTKTILLKPKFFQLNEIVIQQPKLAEEIEIGNYETNGFRFGVGNINSAVFFRPDKEMLAHPFLKKIKFMTKSKVDNAKIRIRILSNNSNNSPDKSLLDEEIIITVKKGKNKNLIDLRDFHFKIPKEGFFVSFEKLLIESNKYFDEFTYKDNRGNKVTQKSMSIEPELCYVPEEKDIVWQSSMNGKWIKASKQILDKPKSYENLLMRKYHDKYLMPSMKIILTN